MTVVCDMGPLQYLILIGCDHVLPALFEDVLTWPSRAIGLSIACLDIV